MNKFTTRSERKRTASAIKRFNQAKNDKAQVIAQAQRTQVPKIMGTYRGTLH